MSSHVLDKADVIWRIFLIASEHDIDSFLLYRSQTELPIPYLAGCYDRASKLLINRHTLTSSLEEIARDATRKVVSYCKHYLSSPNFYLRDEWRSSKSRSVMIMERDGDNFPPGVFEDLFCDADFAVFERLYEEFTRSGEFWYLLKLVKALSSFTTGAKALVNHEKWIPNGDHVNGRTIVTESILGPFFDTSAILYKINVVKDFCLDESVTSAVKIQDELGEIFISLLENTETQDRVFEYIAETIKKNSTRAQMQANPDTCASSGAFLNLSVVMLRLCEPFLDPNLSKPKDIDPSYLFFNTRLDFTELMTLHASSSEYSEFKHSSGTGTRNYSVICEIFFMTARVLHLGLIKTINEHKEFSRQFSEGEETLAILINNLSKFDSSEHIKKKIEQRLRRIKKLKEKKLCYEAQLKRDVKYLKHALEFYRLVLVWLVDMVGGFKMPLSSTSPKLFACMPEHFVEDAMDLLLFASGAPEVLDGIMLNDFMKFIVMFMATPEYIRNPYLRKKMVEVLGLWTLEKKTVPLFEGDELVTENLVGNCLKLYVDIQVTYSDWVDKREIRHSIVTVLEYLSKVPSHRIAWTDIAKEMEKGMYLHFLNFLITDSSQLLEVCLKTIAEVGNIEAAMSNEEEWKRKLDWEREEMLEQFYQYKYPLVKYLPQAMENMGILESTVQLTTAPFILPEMIDTVANMLNYLLLQVVRLERMSLSSPKELVEKIVEIYIYLERGDEENVFPAAISREDRSYSKNLFRDAVYIFAREGGNNKMILEFTQIWDKAETACLEALAIEEVMGDIPDEFLDPIQATLMKDPVILPSTNTTMDRPVIQRILLNDPRDPFNRSKLTQDMLIPHVELKAKIEEFMKSKSLRCCR